MKKFFAILTCSLLLTSTCSAKFNLSKEPRHNISCITKCVKFDKDRLEIFPKGGQGTMWYDTETVIKHNKFSPFGDRIIELWLFTCYEVPHTDHFFIRHHVRMNLDKRKYSFNHEKESSVPPGTWVEKYFHACESIY